MRGTYRSNPDSCFPTRYIGRLIPPLDLFLTENQIRNQVIDEDQNHGLPDGRANLSHDSWFRPLTMFSSTAGTLLARIRLAVCHKGYAKAEIFRMLNSCG